MIVSAVLFDLDGTLVDSLEDLTDAVNHMLTGFSKPKLAPADIRQMIGKGSRNLVQRALATDSSDDIERGLELFEVFNAAHIADKSGLYPGARETLEELAAHGIPLAIVSNKNESLSRLILETLDVDRFFSTITGGDTYPERKPSPLPLMRVIGDLGILPDQAVMVGDSINDIQAGKQAGIITIGCTWGYGGDGELREADFLAASCNEVAGILLQREG